MDTAPKTWPRPFTGTLKTGEAIAVLLYLPLHAAVLPRVFSGLLGRGMLTAGGANFAFYGVGFLYMLIAAFGFLRREFDALADAPLRCIAEVLTGYGLMLIFNLLVGVLLLHLLPGQQNLNNAALVEAASEDSRAVLATVTFLAPPVEEMLFRAGIFGLLRRRSRLLAYAVSVFCFSLYHVLPYAIYQPVYWVFLIQYLPASFLLTRCYERTNCIWCSIFFHMLVNGVALSVLQAVSGLL